MTATHPQRCYDLAIIGAGPAGMAAATEADALGLDVTLIDEQPEAGGQIYRAIGRAPLADERVLGPDYYYGRTLLEPFQASGIDYQPETTVWGLDDDLTLNVLRHGHGHRVKAHRLLIATGAQERPVPFPGWTLPGVMTCGAAQVLLKTSALTPPAPLVLAGSGPLLLLVAVQLSRAGVPIEAVLDTTPRRHYLHALRELPRALRHPHLLLKGVALLRELRRAGIRHLNGVASLAAEAGEDERLAQVRYRHRGRQHRLPCTSLLVHQGVVPNVQLTRALELAHRWDARQQCWHPQVDAWGETPRQGIFVAGDSSGIAGAPAAETAGRLAALQVACQLGRLDETARDTRARPLQQQRTRQLASRPFLDALYRPAHSFLVPDDETLVCRCEEVTAGELRRVADAGCQGPNQAKAFCRAGMGPCQGRLCGLTVAQVLAERRHLSVDAVGYYHIRPPIKPLTLGELADIAD